MTPPNPTGFSVGLQFDFANTKEDSNTSKANAKLQDTVVKVTSIGSESGTKEVSANVGVHAGLSIPSPVGQIASIHVQTLKMSHSSLFERVLLTSNDVKSVIVTCLCNCDLSAFQVALGKGTNLVDSTYHPHFKNLHSSIRLINQKRILAGILADHPDWQTPVMSWKGISIEEKVWLLQLYELHNLGVRLPQIDTLHSGNNNFKGPSPCSLELLKPNQRNEIEQTLSKTETLDCSSKKLKKCPDAICLLVNLKRLCLKNNKLKEAPDTTHNLRLEELDLSVNDLTAPPYLRCNVRLQKLYLNGNDLKIAPDLRKNSSLRVLDLSNASLKLAPDLSHNTELQEFKISENELTTTPNVRRNVKLQILDLSENLLVVPPDVSQNRYLNRLILGQNKLTTSPDVTQNVDLEDLYLSNNELSKGPDISQNLKLKELYLHDNPLTDLEIIRLKSIRKQRPNLNLLLVNTVE